MPRAINDKCNNCGECVKVCPENAITAGVIHKIDPLKCTDCLRCVGVCVRKAIVEYEEIEIPLDNSEIII